MNRKVRVTPAKLKPEPKKALVDAEIAVTAMSGLSSAFPEMDLDVRSVQEKINKEDENL